MGDCYKERGRRKRKYEEAKRKNAGGQWMDRRGEGRRNRRVKREKGEDATVGERK